MLYNLLSHSILWARSLRPSQIQDGTSALQSPISQKLSGDDKSVRHGMALTKQHRGSTAISPDETSISHLEVRQSVIQSSKQYRRHPHFISQRLGRMKAQGDLTTCYSPTSV
jgi:hypothetical protein